MKVTVKLFALARHTTGSSELVLDLPDAATIADLRSGLSARYPEMAPVLSRSVFAVGTDYAAETRRLKPDDDIALIPPVSGG